MSHLQVIVLVITALYVFYIHSIRRKWTNKCKKSAKENRLKIYIPCFIEYAEKDNNDTLLFLLEGILGVNETQLVFAHHFKDTAMYIHKDFSDIQGSEQTNYEDKDFYKFTDISNESGKITYIDKSMMGFSKSKQMHKYYKKQKVFKVHFADEIAGGYFFYIDNPINDERIKEMQKIMQMENNKL
jgi:hypothetical protein